MTTLDTLKELRATLRDKIAEHIADVDDVKFLHSQLSSYIRGLQTAIEIIDAQIAELEAVEYHYVVCSEYYMPVVHIFDDWQSAKHMYQSDDSARMFGSEVRFHSKAVQS